VGGWCGVGGWGERRNPEDEDSGAGAGLGIRVGEEEVPASSLHVRGRASRSLLVTPASTLAGPQPTSICHFSISANISIEAVPFFC
jgi:hypothetical protein